MNRFIVDTWKFWDAIGPVANGILRNMAAAEIAVRAFTARPPRSIYILDLGSSLKAVWN